MRLSQISGQTRAIAALGRAVAQDRVAGAYLFVGPQGVGKRTTALALFCALNCEDQGCEQCTVCTRAAAGLHPDLVNIVAEERQIKIEQVRALADVAAFPPHEARRRVVIIDGADTLNANAANALLKATEEPRPDTHYVLVSAAPHRVLLTLRSRCQFVRFVPLADEPLREIVARSAPDQDEAARARAVALADGSPGRALELLADESLVPAIELAQRIQAAIGSGDAQDAFALSENLGTERALVGQAFHHLRHQLRDVMLRPERTDEAASEDKVATRQQQQSSLKQLWSLHEAQAALDGNVNPRLVVETLIFAAAQLRWGATDE